ncbi:LacI family DNA-binding transcriptional regulator [Halodurantibacterium flavum]|uniref:LacI family DNA-binding transcriptional regulator n=1 Tax=Halodurantibacterium flavum TaxID=1382802 RepID=A0ABW4S4A4_9RHOB
MTIRMRATIQDVAREAGVSAATVSRVMSAPGIVAPATRAAVLDAIERTGYRVHHSARNLRQQRTGSIVALVPNISNPFFSNILSGIAATLGPEGYNLLIGDTRSGPGAGRDMLRTLGNGVVDGVILFDGEVEPPARRAGGLPTVMACEWRPGPDLPSVRVDNAGGARMAVEHLVALGHRRIGHLAGPPKNVLTVERLAGFRDAMAAAHLSPRPDWMLAGDFTLESGAAAGRRWLALPDRPTALFCASDEMACGFIGAVQAAGMGVPRDVSVVGFDNIELVAHLTPPLTTIRQQRNQIGIEAARLILAELLAEPSDRPPPRQVLLPVELILRASTAPPAIAQVCA